MSLDKRLQEMFKNNPTGKVLEVTINGKTEQYFPQSTLDKIELTFAEIEFDRDYQICLLEQEVAEYKSLMGGLGPQ